VIDDNRLLDLVLFLAVLLPSVVLHEVSHGVVAERLGDPTARRAGRITLNPIRHFDPVGSLLFPAVLAAAGQSVWGWARPVPVQPGYFRNPTRGMAWVALAGPATNLALAAVAGRLGPFLDLGGGGGSATAEAVVYWPTLGIGATTGSLWARVLFAFVLVNCALAVFNMLPIPPLDGSRLLPLALPPRGRELFNRVAPYGFLIIFLLVVALPGALSFVSTAVGWILRVVI
jgi:Zn-dependent protease